MNDEPTDWQQLAKDYLSDAPDALRSHLPAEKSPETREFSTEREVSHSRQEWTTTVRVRLDLGEIALLRAGLHHLSSVDFNYLDRKLAIAQRILGVDNA